MENNEIDELFKEVGEKRFTFLKKEMQIISYRIDGNRILINTDSDALPIIRRRDDIGRFFEKINNPEITDEEDYMTPIERDAFSPKVKTKKSELTSNYVSPQTMGVQVLTNILRDTLLEDIEKLKNDRGYINQAKARNNNVNSLINLARLQIRIAENKT